MKYRSVLAGLWWVCFHGGGSFKSEGCHRFLKDVWRGSLEDAIEEGIMAALPAPEGAMQGQVVPYAETDPEEIAAQWIFRLLITDPGVGRLEAYRQLQECGKGMMEATVFTVFHLFEHADLLELFFAVHSFAYHFPGADLPITFEQLCGLSERLSCDMAGYPVEDEVPSAGRMAYKILLQTPDSTLYLQTRKTGSYLWPPIDGRRLQTMNDFVNLLAPCPSIVMGVAVHGLPRDFWEGPLTAENLGFYLQKARLAFEKALSVLTSRDDWKYEKDMCTVFLSEACAQAGYHGLELDVAQITKPFEMDPHLSIK